MQKGNAIATCTKKQQPTTTTGRKRSVLTSSAAGFLCIFSGWPLCNSPFFRVCRFYRQGAAFARETNALPLWTIRQSSARRFSSAFASVENYPSKHPASGFPWRHKAFPFGQRFFGGFAAKLASSAAFSLPEKRPAKGGNVRSGAESNRDSPGAAGQLGIVLVQDAEAMNIHKRLSVCVFCSRVRTPSQTDCCKGRRRSRPWPAAVHGRPAR